MAAIPALFALVAAAPARAQSGTQVTPDGKRALVSKDVGGQRWAISRNPDHTVTGNVFFPGGGAPQFVFCSETGESGGDVSLSCSGADACPLGPCEPGDWLFIADVTLPLTFFGESADVAQSLALPSALVTPMTPVSSVATAQSGGTESAAAQSSAAGLQVTPNGALTLISKDVGDQRWAITRNDDGTVTGNVFFPGGGEPKFVWCEPTSDAADPVALRCLGADACATSGGCGSEWTLIADVSLPASFFQPRAQASAAEIADALTAQLGEDAGFDAIALALTRGYSVAQIARAALTGRLRATGEIVVRSGATEPPTGPAIDLFTDAPASALPESAQANKLTLDAFQNSVKNGNQNAGLTLIVMLLYLIDAGYTVDQIALELFFGNASIESVDGRFRLVDPADPRHPIAPDGSPKFQFDTCGNGKRDDDENCEGTSFKGPSQCLPPLYGAIKCTSRCTVDDSGCHFAECGDGEVNGFESCDGANLHGATCEILGLGSGVLKCSECEFDTSQCATACAAAGACCPTGQKRCGDQCIAQGDACCGDGVRQGSEACDGSDLGGASCASVGQGSGTLACSGFCTFDTSGCHGGCPDGTFACEGGCAPSGSDCCEGEQGYCSPGSVCVGDLKCCPSSLPQRCGNTCNAVGSSCCGNGVKEPGEECDGADLGGASCAAGGTLACTGACTLDPSGCNETCPEGAFTCGDSCAPDGSVCCPETSRFCDAGEVCAGDGGDGVCCPAAYPVFCVHTCYPAGVVCCGDYACPAGTTCAGGGECANP